MQPRDAARLMVVDRTTGTIQHRVFRDLTGCLRPGDLLVVNDTRVMAARLYGVRPGTGGKVEALLVREVAPRRWEALFRPARQAVAGRRFVFRVDGGEVEAEVVTRFGSTVTLDFAREIDPATAGEVPLPPYIKGYSGDPEEYQTIYSRDPRSAAAPTAGLHFTPGLLERLRDLGVNTAAVTLEVGPGTFLPMTADDPRDHHMHAERVRLPAATAGAIVATKAAGGRIVAVGTTVVRTLEHVARLAGTVCAFEGSTELMILPGDRFTVVDALITNFHLPRSTLLMLVSAFAGTELMLGAYRVAVEERYRFYSFGDAMLIA